MKNSNNINMDDSSAEYNCFFNISCQITVAYYMKSTMIFRFNLPSIRNSAFEMP